MEDFIKAKLQSVLEAEKSAKRDAVPNYFVGYAKSIELLNRLRIHFDLDAKPDKLLKDKAPNQDKAEFDYAKANYRPVTFPFWGRGESALNRIWNKDNYTVNWNEDKPEYTNNTAQDYFTAEIPFHENIFSYAYSILNKWKIRDPNALLAVKPYKIPVKEVEGEFKVDKSVPVSPIPVIYLSPQIRGYEEGEWAFVELTEKSLVDVGQRKKREGRIFEFYDKQDIYRVTQVGVKNENKFDIEIYYTHKLGYLPTQKLKGIPEQKEDLKYYLSYFIYALPNLDDAVVNNVTLQLSIFAQAYPHKWAYSDRCTAPGCVGGKIIDSEGKSVNCPVCNGTGEAQHSALSVTTVKLPDNLSKSEMPSPPFVGFEAPDIKILDFLKERVRDLIYDGFSFLNIDVSNSNVKGSETALARQIDREEFYSFLILFSNEMFDLVEFSIKTMGLMRYTKFDMPAIIRPTNFTLRTFKEITEEIAEAKKSGIPDIAITQLLEEYSKTRFNTAKNFNDIFHVILKIDELITKNDQQILIGINSGTVMKEKAILHNSIMQLILAELQTNPDFLEKDISEIKEILMSKIKVLEIGSNEDLLK